MRMRTNKKLAITSQISIRTALSYLIAFGLTAATIQFLPSQFNALAKQKRQKGQTHHHYDLSNPQDSIFDENHLKLLDQDEPIKPKKKSRRSGGLAPQALAVLTVINTGDAGAGSLRAALTTANIDGMENQIIFNIPVADPGFNGSVFTIQPVTPLPNLTSGDTFVDGASQTAFTGDSNPAGPEVVLNGALQLPINNGGFRLFSANNRISDLVINGFPGPGGDGVRIIGLTATNNVVTGCYIGTDPTGTSTVPNGGTGVSIIAGANSNRVGGTAAADRNVISGNNAGINNAGTPCEHCWQQRDSRQFHRNQCGRNGNSGKQPQRYSGSGHQQ